MIRHVRGAWRVVLLSLVWSASPACHGRDISLGSARGSAGDLSRCGGSACESAPEFRGELDESNALPCSMRDGGRLVSVWQHSFRDESGIGIQPEGCTEIDGCELWDTSMLLTTTSEGALWVAAIVETASLPSSPFRSAAGIWMARYAPDGNLLGARTVEVDLVDEGDLLEYFIALTAAGSDVLLGVVKRRALAGATDTEARSWVQRFDASGEAVGARLELEGDYPGRDGPLTIGAADDEGGFMLAQGTRLAGFEAGQRRWVQVLSGFPNVLAADYEQGFSMLAEFYEPTYLAELARYDARGQPVWLRTTQASLQPSMLALDAHGVLFRAGALAGNDGVPGADPGQILHRISQAGDTQWVIALRPPLHEDEEISGVSGQTLLIRGEDEHIWLSGATYNYFPSDPIAAETAMPEYGSILYEVAPDASYCRAYELPELYDARFVPAPDGEFYYVADGRLGRLRTP